MGDMYDPSMRVLTVLELLQARGRISARELRERLEVSPRTVQRYIARLQDLGIPVTATRGRGAQYRLRPSFRMPPIMLNEEEAFTLALGLSALQQVGLTSFTPNVTGLETKLERVVPEAIWQRSQTVSQALRLGETSWKPPVDAQQVALLAEAVGLRQQLTLTYEAHRGELTTRGVQPLGLVWQQGTWFLAAYCLLRQDQRLFNVSRVAAIQRTNLTFEPPEGFDAQAFVEARLRTLPTRWQTEVWLAAEAETIYYDLLPPSSTLTPEEGGLTLRAGVNDLEGYAARLLALGCDLEVRSPDELTGAFAHLAKRAARFGDYPST